MIKKDDHSFLVLENEWIDNFHVTFLHTKLHKIGQVLETFGNHDQGARGSRRGRFWNKWKSLFMITLKIQWDPNNRHGRNSAQF